jgi:hypothetical protein
MAEARPGVVVGSEAQRRYKNLEVGCRVSGSFGEYHSNPNPNICRCVRSRLYGNIVCALDQNRYKVGQLASEAPQPTDYLNKKAQAVAHVDGLLGQTVTMKHKGSSLVWTVLKSWDP